jgi:hypothetical protein
MNALWLVGLVFLATPADKEPEATASKAALAWLQLVDTGQYGASWDQAAPFFQKAITKENWQKAVQTARAPLGKFISRKQTSAQYTQSLPGAPDGKYVVVLFASVFENKKEAVESVTPMLAPDGQWRVSGYFIK